MVDWNTRTYRLLYQIRGYRMQDIGTYLGVRYSTVSHRVRQADPYIFDGADLSKGDKHGNVSGKSVQKLESGKIYDWA